MNRNKKFLIAVCAIIIIAIPTGLLSWMFLFREPPPDDEQPDLNYADLSISSHSLENDNLTFTVKNQGEKNATGIEIIVEITSLSLLLYNNSLSPLDLEINEIYQIHINLTDYHSYFIDRYIYSIIISLDPGDLIEESSEINNHITIDYSYLQGELIRPNTYAYNSTIDNLMYAVQFKDNQILIEDSLEISNGIINGYSVVNSTILNNSTPQNSQTKISFALYGKQNLTLNNIWNPSISLIVCENSSVSLNNCSIYELRSFGNNSITINNSTLQYCITSGTKESKGLLTIKNNSYLEMLMIIVSSELEIESSSINSILAQPTANFDEMEGYEITGEITYTKLNSFISIGKSDFLITNTNISSANLMGNSKATFQKCIISSLSSVFSSKAILNESKILDTLVYGITISSGSVNITNGEIEGDYLNSTELINSNVSDSNYNYIMVNGTGQLSITNYSCNIFLYDSAKLELNESNITSSTTYTCFLQDTSELSGNNCSFETLLAYGEARVNVDNKSIINFALLNTTEEVNIQDTFITQLFLVSDNQAGETSHFTNCTIDELYVYPIHKVNLTNLTINNLYEGFILESSDIEIDPSGINGPGNSINYINLEDTTYFNRSTKYLIIRDDINVSINNVYKNLVIHIDNGTLDVFNSTISSLQMKFDSVATLNNCTFEGSDGTMSQMSSLLQMGAHSITCYDTSSLTITNNTKIPSQMGIQLYEYSELMLEDSYVELVIILSGAKLSAFNSEISQIMVNAYRPEEYSVVLNNSTIGSLITYSWNFIQTGEVNIFARVIF